MRNKYEVRGDVTVIFLDRKDGSQLEALIDTADLPMFVAMPGKWFANNVADSPVIYVVRRLGTTHRRRIFMHHLIMGETLGMEVDHRNGSGLDNRRCNLRLATPSQNQQNRKRRPLNTSGYRGVCWNSNANKWQAAIKRDGKTRYLGVFVEIEDAARAYDTAALELFGEFANPNFDTA